MKIKGIMVNSDSKFILVNVSKKKYMIIYLTENDVSENIIKYVSENWQVVNNLDIKINYDITLINKENNKSYVIKEQFIKRIELNI
mgnify:CR=1 FL=1